uniref:run domain Beclin-1-interacting and cysteine-rich domain-containing protein-like isoform X2 n=1 Tax=Myxine glutinosa TaxID=7769 RepID=UPI00358F69F9
MDEERSVECQRLLCTLRTTVAGLLATRSPNVWNKYGGLERVTRDLHAILLHGLLPAHISYWPLVQSLQPLTVNGDQIKWKEVWSPDLSRSLAEADQGSHWLRQNLQSLQLSPQLRPLISLSILDKYYEAWAFVRSMPHAAALLLCLEAVEQSNAPLLARLDIGLLTRELQPPMMGSLSSFSRSTWSLTMPQSSPFIASTLGSQHRHTHQKIVLLNFNTRSKFQSLDNLNFKTSINRSASLQSGGGCPLSTPTASDTSSLSLQTTNSSSCSNDLSVTDVNNEGADGVDEGLEYLAIGDGIKKVEISHHAGKGQREVQSDDASITSDRVVPTTRKMIHHIRSRSDIVQPSFAHQMMGGTRRPSEGQSLMSFLAEQDFGSCADLERENAHFSISESLIAAIELMKSSTLAARAAVAGVGRGIHLRDDSDGCGEDDGDDEIRQLKEKIRQRRRQIRTERECDLIGDNESKEQEDVSGAVQEPEKLEEASTGGMTTDLERELDSRDGTNSEHSQTNSAEAVALGLLRQFAGLSLPSASQLSWLVSEEDVPQKLLPIPPSVPVGPDDGENSDLVPLHIRVRGTLDWAPPRQQLIFNIHPTMRRKGAVEKQNYRCAGCGRRVEPGFLKRLRYCDYLGRYFCPCCHQGAFSPIPARILHKWDFSRYPVCEFSRELLARLWNEPLFHVQDVNPNIYQKAKALSVVRDLRKRLVPLNKLLKLCRFASSLREQFSALPSHLTSELHVYSLGELVDARSGVLAQRLQPLLPAGTQHIESCQLCQARGFICEFCKNPTDILFAFQLEKCSQCPDCSACFHRACFHASACPRCPRLAARRHMLQLPMNEESDQPAQPRADDGNERPCSDTKTMAH